MVAAARVCWHGQVGPGQGLGTEQTIVSGSVTLDGAADIRGSAELVVASGWPRIPSVAVGNIEGGGSTQLHPWGLQVWLGRGVRYGNGDTEIAPLGCYQVESIESDGFRATPELRVVAYDRGKIIQDARATSTEKYYSTWSRSTFFGNCGVAGYVYFAVDYGTWDSSALLGRSLVLEEQGDRWRFLLDVLAAYGKVGYFDHRGVFAIRDPPNTAAPVWRVAGGENGVLVKHRRSLTRAGAFNAVVATGESASDAPPVRAMVVDADINSATQWPVVGLQGGFNAVPRFFSSPLITTNDQARLAAETMLAQQLGLPYQVDVSAVPNPALEPGDPIEIVQQDGTPAVHVVERVEIPLTADGEFDVKTRDRTSTDIRVLDNPARW